MPSNVQFPPGTAPLLNALADGVFTLPAASAVTAGDLVSLKDNGQAATVVPANGIAAENNNTVPASLSTSNIVGGTASSVAQSPIKRLDNGSVVIATTSTTLAIYDNNFNVVGSTITLPLANTMVNGSVRIVPIPGAKFLVAWVETISAALRWRYAIYSGTGTVVLAAQTLATVVAPASSLPFATWFYQPNAATPYFGLWQVPYATSGGAIAQSQLVTFPASTGTPNAVITQSFAQANIFPNSNYACTASVANSNGDVTVFFVYYDSGGTGFVPQVVTKYNNSTGAYYTTNPVLLGYGAANGGFTAFTGNGVFSPEALLAEGANGTTAVVYAGPFASPATSGLMPTIAFIASGGLTVSGAQPLSYSAGAGAQTWPTAVAWNSAASQFAAVASGDSTTGYSDTYLRMVPANGIPSAPVALGMTGSLSLLNVSVVNGSSVVTGYNSSNTNGYCAIVDSSFTKRGTLTFSTGQLATTPAAFLPSVATPGTGTIVYQASGGPFAGNRVRVQLSSIFGVAQASAVPGGTFPCATKGTFTIPASQSFGGGPVAFNAQSNAVLGNKGVLVGASVYLAGVTGTTTPNPIN